MYLMYVNVFQCRGILEELLTFAISINILTLSSFFIKEANSTTLYKNVLGFL